MSSREGSQQSSAICAIDVTNLEIGTERVKGGGREFFRDEDNGFSHGLCLSLGSRTNTERSLIIDGEL